MAAIATSTVEPVTKKKEIPPPERVVPKAERIKLVLAVEQTVRDDSQPGGIRVIPEGTVLVDGQAAFGGKNLDKAFANGMLKVVRM